MIKALVLLACFTFPFVAMWLLVRYGNRRNAAWRAWTSRQKAEEGR